MKLWWTNDTDRENESKGSVDQRASSGSVGSVREL